MQVKLFLCLMFLVAFFGSIQAAPARNSEKPGILSGILTGPLGP